MLVWGKSRGLERPQIWILESQNIVFASSSFLVVPFGFLVLVSLGG